MKKVLSIPKIFCLFLLLSCLYAGCKDKDTQQPSGPNAQNANDTITIDAPLIGDTTEQFNWDKTKIDLANLVAMQLQCLQNTSGDCTDSVRGTTKSCNEKDCTDPACNRKIVCCHDIGKDLFNVMTNNGSEGHAIFSTSKMRSVVTSAVCGINQIRFSIKKHRYYVTRVLKRIDTTGVHLSHYSVALLKTILSDDKVTSVVLYRSQRLTDNKYAIPFIVYKGETPTYYNLSDTED